MTMTLVYYSIDSLVSLFKRDMATTKILANDILYLGRQKESTRKNREVANENEEITR